MKVNTKAMLARAPNKVVFILFCAWDFRRNLKKSKPHCSASDAWECRWQAKHDTALAARSALAHRGQSAVVAVALPAHPKKVAGYSMPLRCFGGAAMRFIAALLDGPIPREHAKVVESVAHAYPIKTSSLLRGDGFREGNCACLIFLIGKA